MEAVTWLAWAPGASSLGDLSSGHCTDRGELTVNCWANDCKPARTAPAPDILTVWGWPREGAGLGRARPRPPGASFLCLLPRTPSPAQPPR